MSAVREPTSQMMTVAGAGRAASMQRRKALQAMLPRGPGSQLIPWRWVYPVNSIWRPPSSTKHEMVSRTSRLAMYNGPARCARRVLLALLLLELLLLESSVSLPSVLALMVVLRCTLLPCSWNGAQATAPQSTHCLVLHSRKSALACARWLKQSGTTRVRVDGDAMCACHELCACVCVCVRVCACVWGNALAQRQAQPKRCRWQPMLRFALLSCM